VDRLDWIEPQVILSILNAILKLQFGEHLFPPGLDLFFLSTDLTVARFSLMGTASGGIISSESIVTVRILLDW